MNALAKCVLALTVFGLAGCKSSGDGDGGRADAGGKPADLVGNYRIVSGERNGQPIDAKEIDARVRIAKNAITTYDKENKETYGASYDVDTSSKPWRITMTATMTPANRGQGSQTQGLIKREGDTVTLIYALPGGQAPTRFKTSQGQQMLVMRRASRAAD